MIEKMYDFLEETADIAYEDTSRHRRHGPALGCKSCSPRTPKSYMDTTSADYLD